MVQATSKRITGGLLINHKVKSKLCDVINDLVIPTDTIAAVDMKQLEEYAEEELQKIAELTNTKATSWVGASNKIFNNQWANDDHHSMKIGKEKRKNDRA